jgi:hypothetical protein
MKIKIHEMKYWQFGALGIHNPSNSTYKPYFDILRTSEGVPGDVLELGVAKGASLITTALILEEIASRKKVIGIDTFSGFPKSSESDEFGVFHKLYREGQISKDHLESAELNKELVLVRGGGSSPQSISNSGDFSQTSMDLVIEKVEKLELSSRVVVRKSDLSLGINETGPFSVVLLDLDLYDGYANTLDALFRNLSPGGVIYLDEYFSLKFPGPRMAVDEFLARTPAAKLIRLDDWWDFERWLIEKSALES